MPRGCGLSGRGNDYSAILEAARQASRSNAHRHEAVSVLVPVFNRREMLGRTLAALTHQTHPHDGMQVVVADDGSRDGVEEVIERYRAVFDIAHVRQPDRGYRLAAVRNLGTRAARHENIVLLDCDVIPVPDLVESFARILHVCEHAVLLGMRRFVDASKLTEAEILADPGAAGRLPDIATANPAHARYRREGITVDWRVFEYEKTDALRRSVHPFRSLVGAVAAYTRSLCDAVGGYCEEFRHWGGEDAEFGYRLYQAGAYFVPVPEAIGLHQEPPQATAGSVDRLAGMERTNRLMAQKVPLAPWRKDARGGYEVPKVSVGLEAVAETEILRRLDELARQRLQDFEVVVAARSDSARPAISAKADRLGLRLRRLPAGESLHDAFEASRAMYLARVPSGRRLGADALEGAVSILDREDHGALVGGVHSAAEAEALLSSRFAVVRKRDWSRTRWRGLCSHDEDVFAGLPGVATVRALERPLCEAEATATGRCTPGGR